MRTAFTELVGVQHPIVGFNRSPGVVAAVTNAGGFGVLGASAYTPAELDAQLTWIDEQTGGRPYGVDLTRTGKPARQLRSAWHEEWERAGSPAPLPMPLQPMLVNEAWQRIDAAARTGHEGALRLESFFVGQVVGSFEQIRPAGEITRQIVADCEQRIRDLGALS